MNYEVNFHNVLQIARETLLDELLKYSVESYNKDVIIDNDNCFRAIIEWERCIGELIIEESEYVPYRYVSFNILSSVTEEIISIFCWYDSVNDSLEIIAKNKRRVIHCI